MYRRRIPRRLKKMIAANVVFQNDVTPQILGKKRVYAYMYEDLALLLNVSEETLKVYISNGKFDPTNLKSVVEFYIKRLKE